MQLGIGISTFTEMCGLAPSRVLGSLDYAAGGWEHGAIRMLPTGKVEVITGSSAHGQGHETAWSQIVADQLGVPFEDVEVLHGDTSVLAQGHGHLRLALAWIGAIAVVKAAEKVIAKAKPIAAHMMECSEDDLEFADGKFTVKGTDKATGIQDIAFAVFAAHNLPDGVEPTLDSEADVRPGELLVPARHAPLRDRSGHRDRPGDDALVRLRGRHRRGREPAHRRGPGARRARAGHRAGAVRGGRATTRAAR